MPEAFGDGPGKTAQIMIWDGGPKQVFYRWGLEPRERDGRPFSLVRSEGRTIVNPCLVIATEFIVQAGEGAARKRYRVRLDGDAPFFCIAGMWRPASRDWPDAFAALTVAASPDIAPLKDRHMAVVREEDWQDWLTAARPPEEILKPYPLGSFTVIGPRTRAGGDLFDWGRR
ncbi:MAG TPA: SOS response-associated peptidase family protein [Allosphingosinicella sp.]|nr:SOS response-associated peptidase family protein [Allosphingosinicella sp.]